MVARRQNGTTALVATDVDLNPHANGVVQAPQQLILSVTLEGVSKMLFHRYDCQAVEAKGKAGKGTKEKKTDNVESYVYRDEGGQLAVPAENLHASLQLAAKSFQDPRSPRKSAKDLFKAGILVMPDMMLLSRRDNSPIDRWDFLDTRRCIVQQSAVSRTRPGVEAGWRLDAEIHILLPSLIPTEFLREVLVYSGAVIGLCDFRPRFGRYQVTRSEIMDLE